MRALDDAPRTASAWADLDENVDSIDGSSRQPVEINLVPEWMPVDHARSIEAAVIAAVLVLGWVLAIWAYVQLTN